jgi:phenylpyruvate tautomerase PptA (4-oxalocrotonate tautomerase family)
MLLQDFKQNVKKWASDRLILQNGNTRTQTLKLIEEVGEVASEIAKADLQALALEIGDCVTVCVIIAELENTDLRLSIFKDAERARTVDIDHYLTCVTSNAAFLLRDRKVDQRLHIILASLFQLATASGLDFFSCLDKTWEKIKDRKGYLNENGCFIKE